MFDRLIERFFIALSHRGSAGTDAAGSRAINTKAVSGLASPSGLLLGHAILDPIARMRNPKAAAEEIRLVPQMLGSHCYILGATGSGKTTFLMRLVESYLQTGTGFVCLDLRGNLIEKILALCAERLTPEQVARGQVLLWDLDDDEHVLGFNPLRGGGDAHSRAGALHAVLKCASESWGVQIDETLRCALVCLAEAASFGCSLLDLEPFLLHSAWRARIMAQVRDPYARSFFEDRFDTLSREHQATYAQSVLNKAAPFLANPALANALGTEPTFSLAHLLNGCPGQIVLINLAVHRFHEAAYTLGGFIVSALQNVFVGRISQKEEDRRPVGVVIDEFENFASDRFMEIIAENRKFKAHLVLAHQNLSQLDARLRQSLLENCHMQCYFQCGAHDAEILARELYSDAPKELVKAALLRQKVGECHLTLRGERTVRLRVERGTEPAPTDAAVEALKRVSWANYSLPRAQVETALEARRQAIKSLAAGTMPANPKPGRKGVAAGGDKNAADASISASATSAAPPELEVRDHDASEPAKPARRRGSKRQ
jgi:hypothetical protein